jgi:hypothetical protein
VLSAVLNCSLKAGLAGDLVQNVRDILNFHRSNRSTPFVVAIKSNANRSLEKIKNLDFFQFVHSDHKISYFMKNEIDFASFSAIIKHHENSTGKRKIKRTGIPDPEGNDHQFSFSTGNTVECGAIGPGYGNKPYTLMGSGQPAHPRRPSGQPPKPWGIRIGTDPA